MEPLGTYRHKRDFTRTREPSGTGSLAADAKAHPLFVVQIHDARRMHFDFRLEVDGVLKSWAVPKGPSDDPSDKRLAVPTEDHPMEYRTFEGVIPKGEYGGGTVLVWDQGTYEPLSHDKRGHPLPFDEALASGHATFRLEGDKLRGEYALTRFRTGGKGEEAWLLIKAREKGVRPGEGHGTPDPHRARSARTGRTLGQVAERGPNGED
ncbi:MULTISPECIES: DNA polymerase ligase N-terminal domain-containing protein [Streptomyces]|uniref:DNA polymerase ligase N-terminal domain-containing protein n=1 Tax=Streptomyces evansiae TaxID=3075535 RepID=A0ABU2R3W4_9ACTN|nr:MULTISPECIES: DNA polymerase ligase N-terminal domain-containing protein [unclassified Streptomyces]MDT0410390.1 DNA polymerase ligase N-terminal domain-containing protein [Streptomyces sp. DSM 41979]MDT0420755.1 DNA polymerase ligase N-terminal domain-containing protein [Streptomyces sp. DSM 41859]MYQ57078.1 3'-phosphoesterase [Streptomyces sp. SID4926]WEH27612.1 DNA polymerase ligase N-terminal domain-containing protein [Streptomyces sp. AM 3-1-1]SCE18122.1 DNA ligase D, 3'-phosphoesteras